MTTDGLNRVPSGVPAGGQFSGNQHSESPVRLFDRNDGSFLKPSPSRTAEHCINFWSTVEIPDAIIDQVEKVYRDARAAEVTNEMDTYMDKWEREWLAANPEPKTKHVDEWKARFEQEREAYRLSILPTVSVRPEKLGSYDSRQLVRAAQMLFHAPNFNRFPEETDKVLEHEIELYDEVLTVRQIEMKYGLYQLHYAMESVFKDNAEESILRQLSVGIDGVNNTLLDMKHREF